MNLCKELRAGSFYKGTEILRTQGPESGHTERCSGACAAPFGQEGILSLRDYDMVSKLFVIFFLGIARD
jgi:hypothetical protein